MPKLKLHFSSRQVRLFEYLMALEAARSLSPRVGVQAFVFSKKSMAVGSTLPQPSPVIARSLSDEAIQLGF
jgi:hypothetical protein